MEEQLSNKERKFLRFMAVSGWLTAFMIFGFFIIVAFQSFGQNVDTQQETKNANVSVEEAMIALRGAQEALTECGIELAKAKMFREECMKQMIKLANECDDPEEE